MPRNKNEPSSRTWAVLLYEEDETMRYAIESLKSGAFDCAGIIHDRDLDADGNPKKLHYHFVVRFTNAVSQSTFCNKLQLKPNYCMPLNSFPKALTYLVHRGHPDKFQYSLTDCFGSLVKTLERYLNDDTEDERALKIIELLDKEHRAIDMKEFISMCAKEGLFAELRRAGYLFCQLLKEHNQQWN